MDAWACASVVQAFVVDTRPPRVGQSRGTAGLTPQKGGLVGLPDSAPLWSQSEQPIDVLGTALQIPFGMIFFFSTTLCKLTLISLRYGCRLFEHFKLRCALNMNQ